MHIFLNYYMYNLTENTYFSKGHEIHFYFLKQSFFKFYIAIQVPSSSLPPDPPSFSLPYPPSTPNTLGINTVPAVSGPRRCLSHTTVIHIQRVYFWPTKVTKLLVQSQWAPNSFHQPFLWVSYHGLTPLLIVSLLPLWILGMRPSA